MQIDGPNDCWLKGLRNNVSFGNHVVKHVVMIMFAYYLCRYKVTGSSRSLASMLKEPVWIPGGGSRLHCNQEVADPTRRWKTC